MQITRTRRSATTATQSTPAKPAPQIATAPRPTPVLRGAIRRPPVGDAAPDFLQMRERAKADIADKLKAISNAYKEIDEATARIDACSKVIEARLKSVNMTEFSDGVLRAAIEDTYSRQSTYIDPKKFRAAVESEQFWSSVKVILEEASKHLSKTELAKLSDVTPGKKTGTRFTVKPVDSKRKG